MTLRLATPAPINDPGTPFRPVVKVAHRGHPSVVVAGGGPSGLRPPVAALRPTGIPSRSSTSRCARASSARAKYREDVDRLAPRTCAAISRVRGRSPSRVARRRCGHASRSATRRLERALRPGRSCATRGCGTRWARSCESGLRRLRSRTLPTPAPEEQTQARSRGGRVRRGRGRPRAALGGRALREGGAAREGRTVRMKLVQTLVVRDEVDIVGDPDRVPPERRRRLRHRHRSRVGGRHDGHPRVLCPRRLPAADPRARREPGGGAGARGWRGSRPPTTARTG